MFVPKRIAPPWNMISVFGLCDLATIAGSFWPTHYSQVWRSAYYFMWVAIPLIASTENSQLVKQTIPELKCLNKLLVFF